MLDNAKTRFGFATVALSVATATFAQSAIAASVQISINAGSASVSVSKPASKTVQILGTLSKHYDKRGGNNIYLYATWTETSNYQPRPVSRSWQSSGTNGTTAFRVSRTILGDTTNRQVKLCEDVRFFIDRCSNARSF